MARSRPLIVDPETGEPRHIPPTYYKYAAWKVIVKDLEKGKRRSKNYFSLVEAKASAAAVNEKYGERVEAHVVSRAIGYGPPYSKISDLQLLELNEQRKLWCPYCRKLRRFLFLPAAGRKACEFCHIVIRDFHVVLNNPIMWDPKRIKRLRDGEPI